MAEPTIYPVRIISQQPDGYRRASITLKRGVNEHRVTEHQLEGLKKDPRLAVSRIAQASEDTTTTPNMEPGSICTSVEGVEIDLAGVDPELHPFIGVMAIEQFTKKPSVEQLSISISDDENGETVTGELKPTAAQRDAAWQVYQSALKNVEQ
ncbi:HI1506-related protein [Pseudoalteromonas maricaloris]|uniref:HI1506-related protein n=1 Tax=Pseudoalteromonas maricaloris TaxID=184924 RepID=UPI00029A77F2|nr:HI1506-related protein [Pseudoalteromonas flavipulchra]